MALDPAKIVLYTQGTFDGIATKLNDLLPVADAIGTSGVGTVLLGQWHVLPNGSVWADETPVERIWGNLAQIVQALKQGGNVQNVLISFGPFGGDFTDMQANATAFHSTMNYLVNECGVNGFDWDVEKSLMTNTGQVNPAMVNTVASFTNWATSRKQPLLVTAAPYSVQPPNLWWGRLWYVGAKPANRE